MPSNCNRNELDPLMKNVRAFAETFGLPYTKYDDAILFNTGDMLLEHPTASINTTVLPFFTNPDELNGLPIGKPVFDDLSLSVEFQLTPAQRDEWEEFFLGCTEPEQNPKMIISGIDINSHFVDHRVILDDPKTIAHNMYYSCLNHFNGTHHELKGSMAEYPAPKLKLDIPKIPKQQRHQKHNKYNKFYHLRKLKS